MRLIKRLQDWWKYTQGKRTFKNLLKKNFNKVWRGKERAAFHRFLRDQAMPAGAFLVTWETVEGGLVWFHYVVKESNTEGCCVSGNVEFAIPPEETPELRECPAPWKGLPVWRVPL